MSTPILWIEISVADIDRATTFYENVFGCKLERRVIFGAEMALFSKEDFGIKGALVLKESHGGNDSIKPIFHVNVMSDTIEIVKKNGGEILTEPSILRQKNKDGDTIIGTNLIDGQVGYFAEIKDTEDNHFYLYSHY